MKSGRYNHENNYVRFVMRNATREKQGLNEVSKYPYVCGIHILV